MRLSTRDYQDRRDLARIADLLRQAYGREPLWNAWTPVRFDIWAQRRIAGEQVLGQSDWHQDIRLWEREDAALAGAAFMENGALGVLVTVPGGDAPVGEMIDWLEARCAQREGAGTGVHIEAMSGNRRMEEALAARGYPRQATYMTRRRKTLDAGPAEAVGLPPGYRLKPLQLEDTDGHLRAVKAVFNFQDRADVYCIVQQAPSYVPELDLVVTSAQGEVAAFCTVWIDRQNQAAEFEPVGTVLEHRRLGLGRALLAEACNRLRRLGCPTVGVDSWSESPAANGLYQAAGFLPIDRLYEWEAPVRQ